MQILFQNPTYGSTVSELLKSGTITIVVVNAQSYPFLDLPLINFYHGLSSSANPTATTDHAYFVPEQQAFDWMAYVERYNSVWRLSNWQIIFTTPTKEGKVVAYPVDFALGFSTETPFVSLVPLADTAFTVRVPDKVSIVGSVESTVIELPQVQLAESQSVGITGSVAVSQLPAVQLQAGQSVNISNTPSVTVEGTVQTSLAADSTIGVYNVVRSRG